MKQQTLHQSDNHTIPLLTFQVAGQRYGIPITDVFRIIEMVTITHLPEAPDSIRGIINMHGKAIPVMDLRFRFGLPPQPYGLHTPIILTDNISGPGQLKIGLVVDVVDDVLYVSPQDMEIVDTILPLEEATPHAPYLTGVAKVDRQMILVLDVQALLLPPEKSKLAQALEPAGEPA